MNLEYFLRNELDHIQVNYHQIIVRGIYYIYMSFKFENEKEQQLEKCKHEIYLSI